MQADGSSRSACTAAPFSWPDSSSPKSAWLLHLHPFNGMSRSSVLNLRRRLPRSHPVRNHLLQRLSDRLNVTLQRRPCIPHLLRQRSRPYRQLPQALRQRSSATPSKQPSPRLTRLPHNCLNALLWCLLLPNFRKQRMNFKLPYTRHRHRSRPPLIPAHCPRWRIRRLQTLLSPQKCQDRHHNTSPAQTASLVPSNSTTQALRKPDYGWLAGPLLQRIEALKQYPATARLHRLEGRVIVRIVIQQDGHITSATIARSSGHDVLDQAALETIRQASPLTLSQPLEKSSVTMQIPLGYYLDR